MKRYINAELLRKEIESRMGNCDANSKNPNQLLWAELAALIPFIDSLQQEQPCEELEVAARLYAIPHYMRDVDVNHLDEYPYNPVAEEDFIAGAEWQKAQMPMPEDTVIFQKGIEEGKRLMLEEAVEGYVNYYEDGGGKLMAEAQVGCPYHIGDKVKIVIVKEDKK